MAILDNGDSLWVWILNDSGYFIIRFLDSLILIFLTKTASPNGSERSVIGLWLPFSMVDCTYVV